MRASIVEIPIGKSESQRKFRLDKGLRDSISDYLHNRWPSGTAKNAARAFSISLDRAREAAAGRASLTTVECILKQGGWSVALPIVADVIGHQVVRYLRTLKEQHERDGETISQLVGDWGSEPPAGRDDPGVSPWVGSERRQFANRRVGEG